MEGGGIVVLLLSSMQSLTQLFSLTMDVHSRLRTDSHQDVTGAAPAPCPTAPPSDQQGDSCEPWSSLQRRLAAP